MISAETIRALLLYDAELGQFTWLPRTTDMFTSARDCRAWNTRFAGKPAGSVGRDGYLYICVNYYDHLAHRLAWLYEAGRLPALQIDHVNGRRGDNRFSNLRLATRAQNAQNMKVPVTNTSGFVGVSWDKSRQKWSAQIQLNGKKVSLGRFQTAEEASAAYLAAKRELHPFQPAPRQDIAA